MRLGPVELPVINNAGTFPIGIGPGLTPPDYGSGIAIEPTIYVHRFEGTQYKREQRFYVGPGARKFNVKKLILKKADIAALATFFTNCKGIESNFTYSAPLPEGGSQNYTCRFAEPMLSVQHIASYFGATGVNLIEDIVGVSRTFTSSATLTRIPNSTLTDALLDQAQEIIPLIRIVSRDTEVPEILISDRCVEIDGKTYVARLVDWDGISQSIEGGADNAQFVLGNADDVVTTLVNVVDLFRASVEFSLFHVGTRIKLDLWAGFISDNPGWSIERDTVRLTASDGIYSLASAYPVRRISRICWKEQGDGVWCHGNPSVPCGKVFQLQPGVPKPAPDVNGCNSPFEFGGIIANPQAAGEVVGSKTGQKQVSLINDAVYDRVVREIYTDIVMPVGCDVVSGRDENTFFHALGVVGEGPLGGFSQDIRLHTLDGSVPSGATAANIAQGKAFGFRGNLGPDPNPVRFGLQNSPWGEDAASVPNATFAAGTAWADIQREDAAGYALNPVGNTQMTVSVTQGLGGWVWSAPGSRSWRPGLTNPVWIAINGHLRSLGIKVDGDHTGSISAADMEKFFNVQKAIDAAAWCDVVIEALINSGTWVRQPNGDLSFAPAGATEKRWIFRGVIDEERPWREWLQEILNSCLGNFYFEFNKLCITLRNDSGAVEAFTQDNVLLDSVQLAQYSPGFNELTVNFKDPEFWFGDNNTNIYDEDAQRRIGSLGQRKALKGNMSLSGCGGKSHASRFATIRLREELGGLALVEQLRARRVALNTTVLALNVVPGMVVSLTHRRCPEGLMNGSPRQNYIEFRVSGWKLNKDYSITITGKTTTDSMYDMQRGPVASDANVPQAPNSNDHRLPLAPAWMPGAVAPPSNDALAAEDDMVFSVAQTYQTQRDGSPAAALTITGAKPVNLFATKEFPRIEEIVPVIDTEGTLDGDRYYYAAIACYGPDGFSWPSEIVGVWAPASASKYRLSIRGIKWPEGDWDHAKIYCNPEARLLGDQAANVPATGENAKFLGPVKRALANMPLLDTYRIRVKAREIKHSGIIGAPVVFVNYETGRVEILTMIQGRPGDDYDYSGRMLSVLSRKEDLTSPVLNFHIDEYDKDNGVVSLSGPDINLLKTGDVVVIRNKVTDSTPTTITDALIANHIYPDGNPVNECLGYRIRIIYGKGRGQARSVISNDATTYTIDQPWTIVPDETSIFIVEAPGWTWSAETDPINNAALNAPIAIRLAVPNLWNQTIVVGATLVLPDGRETDESVIPLKEVYVFGQPRHTRTVFEDFAVQADDDLIIVDSRGGDIAGNLTVAELMLGRRITVLKKYADNIVHMYDPSVLDDEGNAIELCILTGEGASQDFQAAYDEEPEPEEPEEP